MTKNEIRAADDPTFATSEAAPSALSLGSFVMELLVVGSQTLNFLFALATQHSTYGDKKFHHNTIHEVMPLYVEISSIRIQSQLLQFHTQSLHRLDISRKTSAHLGKFLGNGTLHGLQCSFGMMYIDFLQAGAGIEVIHRESICISLAIEPDVP